MDSTLIKGLSVFEHLAESAEPLTLGEVAARTGLLKSNAHRALQTLIHCGYVRQDANGSYRCTLKAWKVGGQIAERMDIRTIARPYLRRLSSRTSETVHLSVFENREVTYLEKIDSPVPEAAYSRLGGGGPAHCSATGKVLLAYAGAAALSGLTLRRFTARTIVQRDKLARELRAIRRRGYAVTRGEWHEAISGIAAPVSLRGGTAAVGISGLSARLTAARLREHLPAVLDTAKAIESATE